jgi:prophage regulatory protein
MPVPSGDLSGVFDMATQIPQALSILRRKQVEARTGLSRSSIYAYIGTGQFPAPVALGARAVGWYENDVEKWLASRVKQTRPAQ